MVYNITTSANPKDAANFITQSILNQLKAGKKVLFFVTGGSSISVAVLAAELLREQEQENLIQNLTIMMTDERYGPVNHADSNWYQLMQKGFSLPGALIIPILAGDDRAATTGKFSQNLNREYNAARETIYKIGLFGVGADGHTAGILPESGAVSSRELAFSYQTPTFARVTMTPRAIEQLDEVVVWAQGKDKWITVENLDKEIDVAKQPAQILKKVPLLTIFTDYNQSSRAKKATGQEK